VNSKENLLGIGALIVSIVSVVLSVYAGYRLDSIFYYIMAIVWILVTIAVIRVYESLRE